MALSFNTDPIIDAGTRAVVEAHVPFADESGFVAGVVKQLWKSDQLVALRIARRIVDDAVLMRVLAGEKAGAARRTKWGGDERVWKTSLPRGRCAGCSEL